MNRLLDAGPSCTGRWDARAILVAALAWPVTLAIFVLLLRAENLDMPNGPEDRG